MDVVWGDPSYLAELEIRDGQRPRRVKFYPASSNAIDAPQYTLTSSAGCDFSSKVFVVTTMGLGESVKVTSGDAAEAINPLKPADHPVPTRESQAHHSAVQDLQAPAGGRRRDRRQESNLSILKPARRH